MSKRRPRVGTMEWIKAVNFKLQRDSGIIDWIAETYGDVEAKLAEQKAGPDNYTQVGFVDTMPALNVTYGEMEKDNSCLNSP